MCCLTDLYVGIRPHTEKQKKTVKRVCATIPQEIDFEQDCLNDDVVDELVVLILCVCHFVLYMF